jgi:hypothetical protein
VESLGTEHAGVVLAVGAVVLVGALLMGASVAREAIASSTPPHVKVAWSGTGRDGSSPVAATIMTTTGTTPGPAQAPSSNDAIAGQTAPVNVVGAAGAASGDLSQTLSVSVLPGSLTVSPTSDSATFSRSGNAGGQAFRGDLAPVKVVDARGSLVGWNASISLQSVDGLSTAQLAGAQLCATPDTPTVVAGNPGDARAATPSCGRFGEPVSVFFAPAGGGGGTFADTAVLTLGLPAGITANPASATLAVTVH